VSFLWILFFHHIHGIWLDTCPREAVASWATWLRSQHPTLLFRAASSFLPLVVEPIAKGKRKADECFDDALGVDSVLECLHLWAKEKGGESLLTVAVVGLTNVSLLPPSIVLTKLFCLFPRRVKALSSIHCFGNLHSPSIIPPLHRLGRRQRFIHKKSQSRRAARKLESLIRLAFPGTDRIMTTKILPMRTQPEPATFYCEIKAESTD
jgi:hypothetical protein